MCLIQRFRVRRGLPIAISLFLLLMDALKPWSLRELENRWFPDSAGVQPQNLHPFNCSQVSYLPEVYHRYPTFSPCFLQHQHCALLRS
ncbi:hypothetical protein B9Z19DRAFT_1044085 [Tuber borchii]|uniref:Uncharacterized protein n=1 Tax=Tuber borchii TaxID=42251 RepID=A0A2T6ZZ91_TUBBO|nr:hypothetical protein B9Z19DRAFT_1044085 [Tuber borchii]